jgi:hypothetical protein
MQARPGKAGPAAFCNSAVWARPAGVRIIKRCLQEEAVANVPTASGLLVCEQVIIDKRTENVTPVNCFTTLKVEQFPSEPQRFSVFALLTDGFGDVGLEVVIANLANDEEVYRESQRLRFGNPLQQVRFIYRITRCAFPAAGVYEVQLLAEGQLVARQTFAVSV